MKMNSLMITVLLFILLLTSSCGSPYKTDIKQPKSDTIADVVEAIKTPEQLAIASKWKLDGYLNYFIIASMAGIGVCIVLFLAAKSIGGLFAAAGCAIMLILALAVKAFATIFAVVGAALLVLVVVGAVIYVIRNKNALVQVIQSYDKVKLEIRSPDEKTRIKVNANSIQTDETQEIVRKIRAKTL